MRLASFLATALLSVPLLTAAGQAHEFLVVPRGDAARDASVTVEAQAAHIFMQSEEAEKVENVRVELLTADGKKTALALAPSAASKALEGTVKGPVAAPAWLVGHRLPEIWSSTTEGVLYGDRAALEAQGKTVPQAEVGLSYDGYSKEEDTYKQLLHTDAAGKVTLPLDTAGLWLARVAVTRPVKDGKGVDEEQLRSTLVFPVK